MDILLYPTQPLDMSRWSLLAPSDVVGELKTLAILSTKQKSPFSKLLTISRAFTPTSQLTMLITYLITSLVNSIIIRVWQKTRLKFSILNSLFTNIRILLNQPQRLNLSLPSSQLTLLTFWQFGALVLIFFFFNILLEFAVYPEPFETIDCLEDVVGFLEKGFVEKLVAFEGDAIDFFVRESDPLAEALRPHFHNIWNGVGRQEWEENYLTKIGNGEVAFVADSGFLDFNYNAFLHRLETVTKLF